MIRRMIAAACLTAVAAAGCTDTRPPTPEETRAGELAQVGELYRNYQITKKAPPKKLADFTPMRSIAGPALDSIKSGQVVLRYGATLPDTKEEPGPPTSDEVLAYEASVPEKGGQVLMLDRTVKTMTADEFKAAKLAGTPAPEAKKK